MFLLEKVKYKDILDISELEVKTNKVTCIVGESGSGNRRWDGSWDHSLPSGGD